MEGQELERDVTFDLVILCSAIVVMAIVFVVLDFIGVWFFVLVAVVGVAVVFMSPMIIGVVVIVNRIVKWARDLIDWYKDPYYVWTEDGITNISKKEKPKLISYETWAVIDKTLADPMTWIRVGLALVTSPFWWPLVEWLLKR